MSYMVRKVAAIVGSAVFLVMAPGFVAGLVPWRISGWRVEAPLFGMPLLRFLGGILITLGVVGLLDSFGRFALQGAGTPAPVFPTGRLIVTGLYRYVRNPTYVAVVITILGQGLILGNVMLLAYGGLVWLLFHVYVLVYEEPTLRAGFGSEYKSFCAEVPRWIPRFTPWERVIPDREGCKSFVDRAVQRLNTPRRHINEWLATRNLWAASAGRISNAKPASHLSTSGWSAIRPGLRHVWIGSS